MQIITKTWKRGLLGKIAVLIFGCFTLSCVTTVIGGALGGNLKATPAPRAVPAALANPQVTILVPSPTAKPATATPAPPTSTALPTTTPVPATATHTPATSTPPPSATPEPTQLPAPVATEVESVEEVPAATSIPVATLAVVEIEPPTAIPEQPTEAPTTAPVAPEPTTVPPQPPPSNNNEPTFTIVSGNQKEVSPAHWPCQPEQIKGNNNSGIYHVPSGRYYARTYSDVTCFNSAAEAEANNFRASKQ